MQVLFIELEPQGYDAAKEDPMIVNMHGLQGAGLARFISNI